MGRRLNVPTALAVTLCTAACFTGPLENGCGDNHPLCNNEIVCRPPERRDAGTADVVYTDPHCPLCANDEGECPAGCVPEPIVHT